MDREGPRSAFVFEATVAGIVHEFYEDHPIPAKTYAECLSALKRATRAAGRRAMSAFDQVPEWNREWTPAELEELRKSARLGEALEQSVKTKDRFTRHQPCPVCGSYERGAPKGTGERCWGYYSRDRFFAFCTRTDKAGDLTPVRDGTVYPHEVSGDCPCHTAHDPTPPLYAVPEVPLGEPYAVYSYTDEAGHVLYEVTRHKTPEGDETRFRRPNPGGGYIPSLGDVRRVPYRLGDLHQKGPWPRVFLVEGEKDADTICELSQGTLLAMCNDSGAKHWKDEYAVLLLQAGVKEVIILRDNDPVGLEYQQMVAASCHRAGLSVRCVDLPGIDALKSGADVTDWLDELNTIEELLEVVEATPIWTPPGSSQEFVWRDLGTGYRAEWPQDQVTITARHVRLGEAGDLFAEVEVTRNGELIGWDKQNLLLLRDRVALCRELTGEDDKHVRAMWRKRLSDFSARVVQLMRQGDSEVELTGTLSQETRWLVEPFVLKNEPSMFYAMPGAGKSYLGILVALAYATERPICGIAPTGQGRVLILDFETTLETFNHRIGAVCRGLGIDVPTGTLIYKNMRGRDFSYAVPEIRDLILKRGITLVVIDSTLYATSAGRELSEAAMALYRAAVLLGPPVFMLTHGKRGEDRAYGSMMYEAGPRLVVGGKPVGESPTQLTVKTFKRKANDVRFTPICFRLTFEEAEPCSSVYPESVSLEEAEAADAEAESIANRAVEAMTVGVPMKGRDVAKALGLESRQVSDALRREAGKKDGRVQRHKNRSGFYVRLADIQLSGPTKENANEHQ